MDCLHPFLVSNLVWEVPDVNGGEAMVTRASCDVITFWTGHKGCDACSSSLERHRIVSYHQTSSSLYARHDDSTYVLGLILLFTGFRPNSY